MTVAKITERVYMGSIDIALTNDFLILHNIGYVYNLSNITVSYNDTAISIYDIPIQDKLIYNPNEINEYNYVFKFYARHINSLIKSTVKNILICCYAGVNRSGTLAAYYLKLYNNVSNPIYMIKLLNKSQRNIDALINPIFVCMIKTL